MEYVNFIFDKFFGSGAETVLARCLAISLTSLFIFSIYFLYNMVRKFFDKKYNGMAYNSKLIFFTICLTISMCSLQFSAEYYGQILADGNKGVLEILASSFLHTLKAFGADDNFLNGTEHLKLFIFDVFPAEIIDDAIGRYNAIASVMAIVAPITSATIFFELLTNFFPRLKYFTLHFKVFREKYFFSELNERSITLAKSIKESKGFLSPKIVFTNVNDSELENIKFYQIEAKRLGAICLHDNITTINKHFFNKKKILLINDNEVENLELLTDLSEGIDYKSLKKSEIYLFCNDYAYMDIEKKFRSKFEGESDTPIIVPIRHYRNLITNMLEATPLYEPIVHKSKGNRILNVTILGIGDIGTEMFLTTYWIGQMLDCKLRINVVSKEPEGTFEDKLDYINPEILKTTRKNDELLRIYKDKKEFSEPYCEYKYFSCDIKSDRFDDLLTKVTGIADTHYFLVSLGSDEENLSVANMLKTEIGRAHIQNKAKGKEIEKTIINYVVYNSSLNKSLSDGSFVCSCSSYEPDIYMQAVGGIENIYSVKNIFMDNYIAGAKAADESYNKKQGKEIRKKGYEKRFKDEYEYWSNLALRLHFKYKVFSVGFITKSIFDKDYQENITNACKKYIEEFRPEQDIKAEEVSRYPSLVECKLQWLEHRRWCAFLRTMGFRQTTDYEKYLLNTKSHKHVEMKLHPCLVECEKIPCEGNQEVDSIIDLSIPNYNIHQFVVRGRTEDDKPNAKTRDVKVRSELDWVAVANNNNYDLLDVLSADLMRLKKIEPYNNISGFNPYDFKQYDYPNNDYLDDILKNIEKKQKGR